MCRTLESNTKSRRIVVTIQQRLSHMQRAPLSGKKTPRRGLVVFLLIAHLDDELGNNDNDDEREVYNISTEGELVRLLWLRCVSAGG